MKNLTIALVSLVTLATQSAHAVYRPGWERPIAAAQMEELLDSTVGTSTFRLTLNRRQGAEQPTSLTFEQKTPVYCTQVVGAHCPPFLRQVQQFKIEEVKQGACNDTVYIARELMNGIVTRSSAYTELTDHRTSVCKMAYRHMWEMDVSNFASGKRLFVGNPNPVYTAQ